MLNDNKTFAGIVKPCNAIHPMTSNFSELLVFNSPRFANDILARNGQPSGSTCSPGDDLVFSSWPSFHPSNAQLLASCSPARRRQDPHSFYQPGYPGYYHRQEEPRPSVTASGEIQLPITTTTTETTPSRPVEGSLPYPPPPGAAPPRIKGKSKPNPRKGKRPRPPPRNGQEGTSYNGHVRQRQCLHLGTQYGIDLQQEHQPEICFVEGDPTSTDFHQVVCVGGGTLATMEPPRLAATTSSPLVQAYSIPPDVARVAPAPQWSQATSELPPVQRPPQEGTSPVALWGMVCLWTLIHPNIEAISRFSRQSSEIEVVPPSWLAPIGHNENFQSSWKTFAATLNSALHSLRSSAASRDLQWSCYTVPGSTLHSLNLA